MGLWATGEIAATIEEIDHAQKNLNAVASKWFVLDDETLQAIKDGKVFVVPVANILGDTVTMIVASRQGYKAFTGQGIPDEANHD